MSELKNSAFLVSLLKRARSVMVANHGKVLSAEYVIVTALGCCTEAGLKLKEALPAEEAEDGDSDRLQNIHHQIAFLTRAYREVMIRYYLDGHSVAQIAREQGVGENTIRQRLFSARETIRKEVAKLENNNKPTAYQQIDYVIWGTGNPGDGDPRDVC